MADDDIEFDHRMSDQDALMWSIEKDPALRSTITGVFEFDRPIDRGQLIRRFERLSRVVPRLRQRVRSNPLSLAPPRWEVDPNFDLAFHLWWVNAPGDGTIHDVLSVSEAIAMSGFDRARPLWRAVVLEGLAEGRSAIVMKFHHAITDGVGGVRLQLELLDLEPDAPERPMPPPPEVHVLTQSERFVDAALHESRRQLGILKRSAPSAFSGALHAMEQPSRSVQSAGELASSVARALRPVANPMSPLMTGRSLSYRFETLTMPLDRCKKAAKRVGGTLNDAFVGGVARGMHHYHLRHGVECDILRMGIPINIRNAATANVAGNAFVPARIELPIDQDDPNDTMRDVHRLVAEARAERANDLVAPLANVLNRLPTTATTALFGSMVKSIDFSTSNVPGPPFPVYLGGAEMLAQFPFGPLAGAGMNVTLLSYQNDLNIGVNLDPAAIPDTALMIKCLRVGFDEILALARGA
ncbi:MAG TPA: wax ester/triacylglycerol synthase domain-containing protein [Microthrixaceae bacterium]|nr:wax ester/triacylglycerol synthase domain-containing protein [Microthrixaceae bacterium]